MTQLTDSQRALILLAIDTQGRIESYPDNLKGGARAAVVRGLLREDLIAADGPGYALTDAAYEAVDQLPPLPDEDDEETGSDKAAAADFDNAVNPQNAVSRAVAAAAPAKRKETRLDQVVALLMRPQGATIKDVMAATDWQQHSVRGFFAGTLKKKGYEVINEKSGKEDRVYRIKTEEATAAEVAADGED